MGETPKSREAWLTALIKLEYEEVALVNYFPTHMSQTIEVVWKAKCALWPDVEGRGSTPEIAITNLITTGCKLSSHTKNREFVNGLLMEAISWVK